MGVCRFYLKLVDLRLLYITITIYNYFYSQLFSCDLHHHFVIKNNASITYNKYINSLILVLTSINLPVLRLVATILYFNSFRNESVDYKIEIQLI